MLARAPSTTVTLVELLTFDGIAQRRKLRSADVAGIDAATRTDPLREPHRPGAEARAHVGNRHPGLQIEQLDQLRYLDLGRFQLPFSQRGLLRAQLTEDEEKQCKQHDAESFKHGPHGSIADL